MANKVYQNIETAVSFSSAGDVTFTPSADSGLDFGKGRKSNEWDSGATPQSDIFSWRAKTKLQVTPVVGETIDIYMATSDGTIIDGTITAADAEFTDEDALSNMLYLGSFVVDTTTTDSIQTSGIFRMPSRYGVLVWWNSTAAETLSTTASDHDFIITPIPREIQ